MVQRRIATICDGWRHGSRGSTCGPSCTSGSQTNSPFRCTRNTWSDACCGSRDILKSFLAKTAPYYEYSRHVDALGDTLGDVLVRDYAAANRLGLQADFAALVGAANLPLPARAAVRTSPGNRATLWLAAQPAGRSRRDHVRRILFALRVESAGPFVEA